MPYLHNGPFIDFVTSGHSVNLVAVTLALRLSFARHARKDLFQSAGDSPAHEVRGAL